MIAHWRNPALRAAFGIGFCILFAFIGTFTFVNFVLVRPPLVARANGPGVCLFCLPALHRDDASCRQSRRAVRNAAGDLGRAAVAAIGLPLMLSSHLAEVLAGMVLVGAGTFFAQASATGFVGQAATENRGVASGTYLACYFFGGLVGSAVLGQLFDRFGWTACVAGIGATLLLAGVLATRLRLPPGH